MGNTDYTAAFNEGQCSGAHDANPYDGQPGALRTGWAAGRASADRLMERIHRLVPTLGHERAITAITGEDVTLAAALSARYKVDLDEFTNEGGY